MEYADEVFSAVECIPILLVLCVLSSVVSNAVKSGMRNASTEVELVMKI
jgi:hypothetical protein